MSLLEVTQRFLRRHSIRLDASMDEQQLVDESAISRLVSSAEVEPGDTAVEVGPGVGNITDALLSVAGRVIAVEKNPKYVPVLLDRFGGSTRLEITIGDALRVSYPPHDRLVSNLPYMICEALVQSLPGLSFKAAALIVSEGFGQKITANEGMEGYSKLSYVNQLYFSVVKVVDVPRDAYLPEPRASTCIIKVKPREVEDMVERIMRELLRQRGKIVGACPTIARMAGSAPKEKRTATIG